MNTLGIVVLSALNISKWLCLRFHLGQSDWGEKLTAHLQLPIALRNSGALYSLTHTPLWWAQGKLCNRGHNTACSNVRDKPQIVMAEIGFALMPDIHSTFMIIIKRLSSSAAEAASINNLTVEGCSTVHLRHEIKWNANLMQQGNFIDVFLARHISVTYAHHQEH